MSDVIEQRFLAKVRKTNWCWIWEGAMSSNGYGSFWWNKRVGSAHAYAYDRWKGKIPSGLWIDHLCRNRACVNPAHLEAVTPRVNTLRGDTLAARHANQTHCVHGHKFDNENTYWRKDRPGGRQCLACERERRKARADR